MWFIAVEISYFGPEWFSSCHLLLNCFSLFTNITSVTNQTAYLGFTVGLLVVADGGIGNTIFRISLHSEDNMMADQ